jgi:hypothetical protein
MTTKTDIRIAILQRGWVMIGRFIRDGEHCFLTGASVIRRWGTTKGLGELAKNGPLAQTQLDPCGEVEFHELTAVALIRCEEKPWLAHCPA